MVSRGVCGFVGLLGSEEQSLRGRQVMFGSLLVSMFLHRPLFVKPLYNHPLGLFLFDWRPLF